MNFREINPGPQQDGKWRYICSSKWKEQPTREGTDKSRLTFIFQPRSRAGGGHRSQAVSTEGCRNSLK